MALFSKQNKEVFLNPLNADHPILGQVLGICSALAVTSQLKPAIVMGLAVTVITAFANVSQYIVITHNKKTVTGAGTLLGITMEESGVTKAVAIKLENEAGTVNIVHDAEAEPFVEEDVPPEENVYIPPHPPKRKKEEV